MDPSLLLRLLPAIAVAWAVAATVAPATSGHGASRRPAGEVADEVLRALLVGLLAGRLGWLLLGGPDVWRTAASTAVLVRAGVVTGLGVLVAGWWLGRRDDDDRAWRLRAAMPTALAGVATWHAACPLEGTCGGVPVAWGVLLPGRAVPSFPTSWVEAVVAAALAAGAWRAVRRGRTDVAWWLGAAYAAARVLLGLARPALVSHPTSDQVWFTLVAVAAAVVATRVPRAVGHVRGLAVHVAEGEGPVVLLAHGAGSSAAFVQEAFAAPLRLAGWRLATYDLRGHGDSAAARDVRDHHLDRHAADLAAVALAVGARVVGGVSLGGMAAVRAVSSGALAPDAAVAVLPGWTGRGDTGRGPHAAIADEVRRDGVGAVAARLAGAADVTPWIREVVLRDWARHDEGSLAAVLQALDGGEAPTLDELAALEVPLAVVGWPDDPGHPLEVARQWTAAARSSALAESSLASMGEDRSDLGRAAVEALERLGIRP